MTSRDFCFWLQGFFEIGNPHALNDEELDLVKRHLALVFKHEIDPSYGDKKHQDELNAIHNGKKPPEKITDKPSGPPVCTDHILVRC